jgi:hypothetical protein
MEGLDRLVRRHQHEDAEALADQAVDDVEEPGETLADDRFGVRREQLARVLEDEQAPGLALVAVLLRREVDVAAGHHHPVHHARIRHLRITGLREDAHEVVGVLAEERVRVDDVLELAPIAPLPGERAERERLAGARLAVPEDQLAAVRGREVAHEPVELGAGRGRVVRLQIRPLRNGHLAERRDRTLRPVGPELDVDLVRRARVGRREELLKLGHRSGDAVGIVASDLDVDPAGHQADVKQRPVALGEHVLAAVAGDAMQTFARRLEGPRRGRPARGADVGKSAVDDARDEQSMRRPLPDVVHQLDFLVGAAHRRR